jgi:hypothetical protein
VAAIIRHGSKHSLSGRNLAHKAAISTKVAILPAQRNPANLAGIARSTASELSDLELSSGSAGIALVAFAAAAEEFVDD